ncbi:DMT family transporter [Patescibacteria group bacterium]|nr:DMT family transporter [Patescibacteria group bacterium]MBU0964594.1 DMT family transporter [Patescibacteria group bacterium]
MNQNKGLLLVLSTAIISGASIYVNSLAVKFGNPYVFTGLKNLLVGVAFLSLILVLKEWKSIKKLTQRQWWQLVLIGLIGGAIPFLLFFKGLSLTIAAQGSFIHKTLFIFVSFLAIAFLKEKLNKSLLIGLGALLVGNFLFLGIEPKGIGWGDGLVLLATLFWAAEVIIAKKALQKLSARLVIWGRMFFGSVFIFIFLASIGQAQAVFAYNPEQWKWVLITSVFLFGYVFTFYHGLKYVRASVATSVLALGAPITGLITLVANEGIVWAPQKAGGLVLIFIGTMLVIGFKSLKSLLINKYADAKDN